MKWYYVSGGQQVGPVDDAQIEGFVRAGQVRPETLVWHEGMPNWQPYGQVKPAAPGTTPAPPIFTPSTPLTGSATAGAGEVVCAECGKIFPVESTIQIGSSRVCAGCKPVFMQRMLEGGRLQAPYSPAGISESELLAQDYDVNIGSCFQRAWEAFKADPGTYIGVSLLVYLAIFAVNVIPYLSLLLALFFMGPLTAGLWIFNIKKIRGQPADIGDGFSGFSSKFWQYFLVQLIRTLVTSAIVIFIVIGVVIALAATGGLKQDLRNGNFPPAMIAVFVIAGLAAWAAVVYFQVCWLFALPLAADKGMEFWPALQLSRRIVMKHWWMTFWLTFVSGLLVFAGMLACFVGVFVTGPVAFAMLAAHYDHVFGRLAVQQQQP
jgi:hypothetical protein